MEINLEHHFDSAHRLMDYVGACNNIHGHTWKININIKFNEEAETYVERGLNNGILIDFKDIKKIIDYYDHCIILRKDDPLVTILKNNTRLVTLEKNATAEYLSYLIAKNIWDILEQQGKHHMTDSVKVTVFESATANAVYLNKQ